MHSEDILAQPVLLRVETKHDLEVKKSVPAIVTIDPNLTL
jgi:hypothetical protein